MRKFTGPAVLVMLLFASDAVGQKFNQESLRSLANADLTTTFAMYRKFLEIPNDGHFAEQIHNNAVWCLNTFKALGFETKLLKSEGIEHVYAERIFSKKYKNILFYLQIDGQPVDPAKWNQESPFKPVLKEKQDDQWKIIDWENLNENLNPDWRIFARSASDSKGPAMAFITALRLMNENKIKPGFNIKVIMDFQEEMGSPALPALVAANKELFKASMVLIMDGTRHVSNLPTLNFGARGIATISLKVFGAKNELHSGQYGNYAPNPVFKLARLLAEMKDETGKVTIPGFYDGIIISEKEKLLINDMPGDDESLNTTLGIAVADKVGDTYEESLQYPSFNVRGLRAASVGGEVRTIIPSVAIAELDLRLVPETSGDKMVLLVKDFIASKGYHFVEGEPSDLERAKYADLISFEYRIGSKPFRTDLNSPVGLWLGSAMDRTFGPGKYVKQRTTGGSQPIEPFITTLGVPAVSIRIPNPDNNIHAADENLRIGNFIEGIQMCLGILTQKMK